MHSTVPYSSVTFVHSPLASEYSAKLVWLLMLHRFQFRAASELTTHIRQDHHFIAINCPLCFKNFDQLYKIMLHMEHGPKKCKLIHSDKLADLVDKFSGGLLTARLCYRSDVKLVEYVDLSVNRDNFARLMGPKHTIIT
jgi:hypothetical protein